MIRLLQFTEFKEIDFQEKDQDKIHKFIQFLLDELTDELEFEDYKFNHQIYFKEISSSDNIYIWIGEDGIFSLIVCGAGDKSRAQSLKNYINQNSEDFKRALTNLRANLDPSYETVLSIDSRFWHSRFRNDHLLGIGGHFQFPSEYEGFRDTFTDDNINSFKWRSKTEINQVFSEEIKNIDKDRLDDNNQFPSWDDLNSFLQYCYFTISCKIPKEQLVNRPQHKLLDMFKEIFTHMRDTMAELEDL